ncbi:MAG: glutamate-1-semialdehyde 2,1-aminomutase [Bacteroidia bacterium]
MKVIGVTQARINSSRLPRKVLLPVKGKSLLEYHLGRAKKSRQVDKWIVATTDEAESNLICEIAANLSIDSYKGSVSNVLERFYQAVKKENPDYIVRITSDCPLIDASVIDEVVKGCVDGGFDYGCNSFPLTFPDGIDVEIFTFDALKKARAEASLESEFEHVTPYIWKNCHHQNGKLFSSFSYNAEKDYSSYRLTVDEPRDLELIKLLIENLGYDKSWKQYVEYLEKHPELLDINSAIQRNEGYQKSINNDRNIKMDKKSFSTKIHQLIPGGAHTYSKGDDQFPSNAPTGIVKGEGAWLWDIENSRYLDCSMGLGSVTLGHAYKPVLDAVKRQLENGVNFQRPSLMELQAAEAFLSLLPNQDMIKFSKNGSTVTTAAVKLARAFTGRDGVAFPYDHPFYSYDDWFIGSTPCNKGVPKAVQELSYTFKSCDIQSLEQLFLSQPGKIACVIMEPEKNHCGPTCLCHPSVGNYLKAAIELCHKHGALFILDEMVTGFKTAFPGSTSKYGLEPDMITWGKGIANGFSCSALTGTRKVMEQGGILNKGEEKVFLISTTHGAETHTLAALIATIKTYKEMDVVGQMHMKGKRVVDATLQIISAYKMDKYIEATQSYWTPVWMFHSDKEKNSLAHKTYFMQEMIKAGVLFQGAFVGSLSHGEEEIQFFLNAFESAVKSYKLVIESDNLEEKLVGESIKPVFRKYL